MKAGGWVACLGMAVVAAIYFASCSPSVTAEAHRSEAERALRWSEPVPRRQAEAEAREAFMLEASRALRLHAVAIRAAQREAVAAARNPAETLAQRREREAEEDRVEREDWLRREDEAARQSRPDRRAAYRRHYRAYLEARGRAPMQVERYIELLLAKDWVEIDVQAAGRVHEVAWRAPEMVALRAQFIEPVEREMRALVGGAEALALAQRHGQLAAIREEQVEPLLPRFRAAGVPLDVAQEQGLAALLADHRVYFVSMAAPGERGSPTVDWDRLIDAAAKTLTPEQIAVLRAAVP